MIKKYTKRRGAALDQNLGINEQLGDIASNIATPDRYVNKSLAILLVI
jgi:hypothetical protein